MTVLPNRGPGIEIEMQTYLPTDIYQHLLDRLENLFATFDPAAPDCLKTRIAMILGEEGFIWPSYCYLGEEQREMTVPA